MRHAETSLVMLKRSSWAVPLASCLEVHWAVFSGTASSEARDTHGCANFTCLAGDCCAYASIFQGTGQPMHSRLNTARGPFGAEVYECRLTCQTNEITIKLLSHYRASC